MPPLCIPFRTTQHRQFPLLNNNIIGSLFPIKYHRWPNSVSILSPHSFHPFSASHNKKGNLFVVILEEVRIPGSMGISLSRNIINVFLSLYNSKKVVVVPGNLFHVQIEDIVTRKDRHLQRYDKGRRQVVGCIPYRYKGIDGGSASAEEFEVLLVSSQKGGKGMMFPKGGWEINETMELAAMRETREEAGVVGTLEDNLGKWRYKSKSNGSYHDGYMFSLHVNEQLDSWPEKDLRKRRWATVAEAREACPHGWMKEALDELVYRFTKQQNGEPDVFSS